MTRILTVHPQAPEPESIAYAAAAILRGRLVAFPTETVYGLGANALDAAAVARIFIAKDRPPEDPLIVHLASEDDLPRVVSVIPPVAHELARAFWPGPLTLILPKHPRVPDNVTAGLSTVAVRVPAHPVAFALLQASGVPIAAPSANRFGHPSPTTAQHVMDDLGSRIDLILDGGPTTIGVESTVLDVTRTPPLILRPGGLPREALEALIGPVAVRVETAATKGPQPSPGLLGRHYAPRAELILYLGSPAAALAEMARLARLKQAEGQRVGVLLADEDRPYFSHLPVFPFYLGPSSDLAQIARNLFIGLRALDEQGVDLILARDFGERGLGLAIRDRLRRAASRVLDVNMIPL
ncbi:MAG: threonylcarbamoyl-AMP synthase [Chloroflexota bacterium]